MAFKLCRMALNLAAEEVLSTRDAQALRYKALPYAIELALLGELDSSRSILSLLFENGCLAHVSYGNTCGGLNYAWELTDNYPDHMPEVERSQSILQQVKDEYENELSELKAKDRQFDQNGLEKRLELLKDKVTFPTHALIEKDKSVCLVQALDISLRLQKDQDDSSKPGKVETRATKRRKLGSSSEQTETFEEKGLKVTDLDHGSVDLVRRIASQWNSRDIVECLTQAEHLWPYYMHGLLADVFGMTRSEVKIKGQSILEAIAKRLQDGRKASPLESKSLKELLQTANDASISKIRKKRAEEGLDADEDALQTFFKDAATQADIEELERSLDITLPDDYKEFLRITNGFGGSEMRSEDGIYRGYFPDPALWPAKNVKWNNESYFQLPVDLLKLPSDIVELVEIPSNMKENNEFGFETPIPLFDRVLELGTRDIDNLWLVHPRLVKRTKEVYLEMYQRSNARQRMIVERAMRDFAGSKEAFEAMEWTVMRWSSGGSAIMTAWASFRKYLEGVTEAGMKSR